MGRFCLFSSIFQLPFYTLVFSEWGCFFLLVRLGRGIQRAFFPCQRKRRRSYRAFWLVVSVAVGVCGTRSDQTVLALFLPSPLRLRCPIKVELISPFSGFIQLSFSIPPSLRATSPIAHTCAEEEINAFLLNCLCFLRLVSILVQHLVMLWDTAGGRV